MGATTRLSGVESRLYGKIDGAKHNLKFLQEYLHMWRLLSELGLDHE